LLQEIINCDEEFPISYQRYAQAIDSKFETFSSEVEGMYRKKLPRHVALKSEVMKVMVLEQDLGM
jgi:hypothetical protein